MDNRQLVARAEAVRQYHRIVQHDEAELIDRAEQAQAQARALIQQALANHARARELADEAAELRLEAHVLELSARHLLKSQAPSQSIGRLLAASTAPPDLQDCLAAE